MRVMAIIGARPNLPKIAPLIRELQRDETNQNFLVHTGQHYDPKLSDIFFQELEIPTPNAHLEVGSGSQAAQTAKIMLAFEPVLIDWKPDILVVVGDVNSTLAAALVAVKLGIPVAHVEAGLRSSDRSMPEEINRIITDSISDLLFTPSLDANQNLEREGVDKKRIHFVGNIMIDTLLHQLEHARQLDTLRKWELQKRKYVLVTLHRPSNVDQYESLKQIRV